MGDGEGRYRFGRIAGNERKGKIFYGEHGGVTGGCAALLVYPEEKMVIAMAANIHNGTLELPILDDTQSLQDKYTLKNSKSEINSLKNPES